MLFEQAPEALATAEPKMQKTAYYDNSTLFGGYGGSGGYGKADAYGYTTGPPQPYAQPALETDYPGSACSLQSAAPIRAPPAHKSSELGGSCMRPGGGSQGVPQPPPPGLGDQQPPPQPPPPPTLPSPSPPNNAAHAGSAKKGKSGPNSSNGSPATISKQIFPWMKESRQNSKQKNSCPPAGIQIAYLGTCDGGAGRGFFLPSSIGEDDDVAWKSFKHKRPCQGSSPKVRPHPLATKLILGGESSLPLKRRHHFVVAPDSHFFCLRGRMP